MGIPGHYSRELPERCMYLIDELLPNLKQVCMPNAKHLGPLSTTFLLAMATPMIVLPLERVHRHRNGEHGAYMNERPLDERLATAVDGALGGRCLKHSRFFNGGQWHFATMPYAGENFALQFPKNWSRRLRMPPLSNLLQICQPSNGQAASGMPWPMAELSISMNMVAKLMAAPQHPWPSSARSIQKAIARKLQMSCGRFASRKRISSTS